MSPTTEEPTLAVGVALLPQTRTRHAMNVTMEANATELGSPVKSPKPTTPRIDKHDTTIATTFTA